MGWWHQHSESQGQESLGVFREPGVVQGGGRSMGSFRIKSDRGGLSVLLSDIILRQHISMLTLKQAGY